jgi:hypothetical protein
MVAGSPVSTKASAAEPVTPNRDETPSPEAALPRSHRQRRSTAILDSDDEVAVSPSTPSPAKKTSTARVGEASSRPSSSPGSSTRISRSKLAASGTPNKPSSAKSRSTGRRHTSPRNRHHRKIGLRSQTKNPTRRKSQPLLDPVSSDIGEAESSNDEDMTAPGSKPKPNPVQQYYSEEEISYEEISDSPRKRRPRRNKKQSQSPSKGSPKKRIVSQKEKEERERQEKEEIEEGLDDLKDSGKFLTIFPTLYLIIFRCRSEKVTRSGELQEQAAAR